MEDGMFASKKKSYFVDDASAATQHPSLILSRQQSELQSGKIRNRVRLNLVCFLQIWFCGFDQHQLGQ